VHERHRPVVAVDAVEDVEVPGRHHALGHERDRRLLLVRLLPALHHARAVRPVAQPGLGDDVPAQRLRDDVRRELAVGEGAVREVPERPLPRDGLVDHADAVDLADEGGVRGGHDPAVQDQLAGRTRHDRHGSRRRNPLARTQR
jgi:hypothetical protein